MNFDDLFAPTQEEVEKTRKADIETITLQPPTAEVVDELKSIRNLEFAPRPLPKVYVEGEYEKDDRSLLEKCNRKLAAALKAKINSPLRFNLTRGAVGAAQEIGLDLEMPETIGDAELILGCL